MTIEYRNPEHYADPTAHRAITQAHSEEPDYRASVLISKLKKVIEQAGFELLARIEIRDRASGRDYR